MISIVTRSQSNKAPLIFGIMGKLYHTWSWRKPSVFLFLLDTGFKELYSYKVNQWKMTKMQLAEIYIYMGSSLCKWEITAHRPDQKLYWSQQILTNSKEKLDKDPNISPLLETWKYPPGPVTVKTWGKLLCKLEFANSKCATDHCRPGYADLS